MTTKSNQAGRIRDSRLEFLDEDMVRVLSAKTGAERLAIAGSLFIVGTIAAVGRWTTLGF